MATEPSTTSAALGKPKAQWNVAETNALLNHLLTNISEAGDGGNYKAATFTAAAAALAKANILTSGPLKMSKHCKNKWNSLKATYQEIQNYHSVSRAHCDSVNGAGIHGAAAMEVFNSYVGSSTSWSALWQFANVGWIFYDKVAELLLHSTGAQGSHTFHAAAAAAPVLIDPGPGAQDIIATAVTTFIASTASLSTNTLGATIETACNTNFTFPCLPIVPPSNIGSSFGTGKCMHDDASFDVKSFTSVVKTVLKR
ncbi:hypothetical protein BDR07DRAFT_1489822 [Suillus spraguei]|nr:hypothetical protein BDR07DRAFT_1489822 [Suillus spraguei]